MKQFLVADPLNPVEIIKQNNTSNLPGEDGYFEIPDNLDHKPCTTSEKLNSDTPQFCYDVPNNNAVIRNEACHDSSPTDKRCEGHEYAEPDEIPKGGEPPAAVYNVCWWLFLLSILITIVLVYHVAAKEGPCSVYVRQSANKGRFGTCCSGGVDPVFPL